MSTFAYRPDNHGGPGHQGPLLVMPSPPQPPKRPNVWMQRLWLAVFVLFCMEVGIILAVLPWTRLWTGNSLLSQSSQLRAIVTNDFTRGLISGLGLVDIWMGVAEAIHYREGPDS